VIHKIKLNIEHPISKTKDLILLGSLEEGAITTQYRLEEFIDSLAHLCSDGIIRRYGKEIGKKEDIEIIKEIK